MSSHPPDDNGETSSKHQPTQPPTPTPHWLWRFSADEWLRSAERERKRCDPAGDESRKSITHARRGVGMALNALLVSFNRHLGDAREDCENRWGRSYVDHIRAVGAACARDETQLDAELISACYKLSNIEIRGPRDPIQIHPVGATPHAIARQLLASAIATVGHMIEANKASSET